MKDLLAGQVCPCPMVCPGWQNCHSITYYDFAPLSVIMNILYLLNLAVIFMLIFSAAMRNITRHWKENLLFAVVSLCVAFFLCIYLGSIRENERQLGSLEETLPITGKVTNLNGGQDLALDIPRKRVMALWDSPYTSDLAVASQLAFTLGLEPPENLGLVRANAAVASNSLAAFPFLATEAFTYLEGYDGTLLSGSTAVCVAKSSFLKEQGFKLGDTVDVSILLYRYDEAGYPIPGYDYHASGTLRIVGSYSSDLPTLVDGNRPNFLFPYSLIDALPAKKALSANSVSFKVDTAALNAFKEEMLAAGFSSTDLRAAPSRKGVALSISDEHYIKAATQLRRTLDMLTVFLPFVFSATAAMGFMTSYLLMRGRRKELAIMRTLGVDNRQTFLTYMLEAGSLTLCGGLLGLFAAAALGGTGVSPLLPALFLLYCIGTAAALFSIQRFSVMEVLTQTD